MWENHFKLHLGRRISEICREERNLSHNQQNLALKFSLAASPQPLARLGLRRHFSDQELKRWQRDIQGKFGNTQFLLILSKTESWTVGTCLQNWQVETSDCYHRIRVTICQLFLPDLCIPIQNMRLLCVLSAVHFAAHVSWKSALLDHGPPKYVILLQHC